MINLVLTITVIVLLTINMVQYSPQIVKYFQPQQPSNQVSSLHTHALDADLTTLTQQAEPLRRPDDPRIPINLEQDAIGAYRQLGFVHGDDKQSLPIYGRKTYQGSDTWEYYVMDDSRNHLKIPLERPNGVRSEIFDGDNLSITGEEGEYTVSLYPRQKIRYIPYV